MKNNLCVMKKYVLDYKLNILSEKCRNYLIIWEEKKISVKLSSFLTVLQVHHRKFGKYWVVYGTTPETVQIPLYGDKINSLHSTRKLSGYLHMCVRTLNFEVLRWYFVEYYHAFFT